MDKQDKHIWGMTYSIMDSADKISDNSTGTLKDLAEDIKLTAKALQAFLEKSEKEQNKDIADDLVYVNVCESFKK